MTCVLHKKSISTDSKGWKYRQSTSWHDSSCLDDTTTPQVSLACAGIESLPADIKGIWIWGQVKQALR